MTPMFSIIIPCYNCEKYISECLNSIITQDYDNYEVICLDDCSQDKTTKIIENYSKKDKRIHLIENTINQGPGILRNQGLKLARGKWVLFCDSDDWYEPLLLKELFTIITKHSDNKVIEFRFNTFSKKDGKKLATWLDRGKSGIKRSSYENIMLATGAWNKCWNKDFLLANGLHFSENNRSGEEIVLHISAFLLAKSFFYSQIIGYNWRILTDSLSHDSKKDKTFLLGVWLMLDVLKSELQRLNLYYKKDYINYCATVLNWHINEKKSFSSAYRKYYINVRRFMIQNRQYLDCNMVYLKIIRTSYIKQMFKYILKGLK